MVFSFLLSKSFDLAYYSVYSAYRGGRWLIYGHEETEDEKKISENSRKLEEIEKKLDGALKVLESLNHQNIINGQNHLADNQRDTIENGKCKEIIQQIAKSESESSNHRIEN